MEQDPEALVSEVLARLRAAARQQQAEAAAGVVEREQVRQALAPLAENDQVFEPPLASPHPLGAVAVGARRLLFRYFLNWWLHPVLEQQNRFNRIASRLIQDLAASEDRLTRRVEQLQRDVARLEARLAARGERPPE